MLVLEGLQLLVEGIADSGSPGPVTLLELFDEGSSPSVTQAFVLAPIESDKASLDELAMRDVLTLNICDHLLLEFRVQIGEPGSEGVYLVLLGPGIVKPFHTIERIS